MSNVSNSLTEKNRYNKKTAYICGSTKLTFADVYTHSRAAATYLSERGIAAREKVLFVMEDCLEWPMFFHGCILIGAIPVVLSPKTDIDMLQRICDITGAKTIITNHNLSELLDNPNLSIIEPNDKYKSSEPYTDFYDFHPSDDVVYFSTSGTTGYPKLVMHCHQVVENFTASNFPWHITDHSIVCCGAKMSFGFGWIVQVLGCLIFKSTHIILPSDFDLRKIPNKINEHSATHLFTNPTVLQMMLKFDHVVLGNHLEYIWCGGEPLPQSVVRACIEKFNKYPGDTYGLSESPCSTILNDPNNYRIGSIGKPAPGVECRIVDEEYNDCEINTPGRLLIKSNMLSTGYYNDQFNTEKTFQNNWLHTNDVVYKDQDGYFYFVGRLDQYVKIRGRFVSALEIENILLGYSDILESSVTFAKKGVDDFMEAFAFVVIENPSVTVTDIRARLTSERYPSHLIPKNIFITKTLPKTVTNKKIRVFSTLMNWQNTG